MDALCISGHAGVTGLSPLLIPLRRQSSQARPQKAHSLSEWAPMGRQMNGQPGACLFQMLSKSSSNVSRNIWLNEEKIEVLPANLLLVPQRRGLNPFSAWAGLLDVLALAADAGGVVRLARWLRQAIATTAGKHVADGGFQADAVSE